MLDLSRTIAYAAVGHVAQLPRDLGTLAHVIGVSDQQLLDCLIQNPQVGCLLDAGERKLYPETEYFHPRDESIWDWIPAWTIAPPTTCEMCGKACREAVCQDCQDTFTAHSWR